MDKDTELKLRLEIVTLKQERQFLIDTLIRLLKHAQVPKGATARSYSSKETMFLKVSKRPLVTALNILKKEDST